MKIAIQVKEHPVPKQCWFDIDELMKNTGTLEKLWRLVRGLGCSLS